MLNKNHYVYSLLALVVVAGSILGVLMINSTPIVSTAADDDGLPLPICTLDGTEKDYAVVRQWNLKDIDTLAIDDVNGYIYTSFTDSEAVKIKKFDRHMNFIKEWQSGVVDGHNPVVVDPTGQYIYILSSTEADPSDIDPNGSSIRKFNSNGDFILGWSGHILPNGDKFRSVSIATDTLGHIYLGGVASTSEGRKGMIRKFSPDGQSILDWTLPGPTTIRTRPIVATDSLDNVYASDRVAGTRKYTPDGALITTYPEIRTGLDLELDTHDSIFTTGVSKFSNDGVFITSIDTSFDAAHSLDIDSEECLYVVDYTNSIKKLCPKKCARVVVTKDVVSSPTPLEDSTDFPFSLNKIVIHQGILKLASRSFYLDDDNDTLRKNTEVILVEPGIIPSASPYILFEYQPYNNAGYTLNNIKCIDPTNDTTTSLINSADTLGRVSLKISGSEEVSCIFTNQRPNWGGEDGRNGRIIIHKNLFGARTPTESFFFQPNFAQGFRLDTDESDDTYDDEKTFIVAPNSPSNPYSIREYPTYNYPLDRIICNDPSSEPKIDLASGIVYLDVAPHETVECTFFNILRNLPRY